jgi:hypothetical protein
MPCTLDGAGAQAARDLLDCAGEMVALEAAGASAAA